MKLLIVGSRSIQDFDLSEYIAENTELIISGGAQGVDTLAEKYADQNKLSKLILRPQYALYGKAAPIVRNRKMVEIADAVLVVWDGKSRGTLSTIRYAEKMQKTLRIIYV